MTPERAFLEFSDMIRSLPNDDLPGPTPTIVFICGTPRSGTTILYQALAHCGRVGYVSNLIARFASNPRLGVRLAQALDMPKSFTGRSTFGRTEHISEPHEFGLGWLGILGVKNLRQPEIPYQLDPEAARRIAQFARAFDQPVVFKSFAYQWFIRDLAALLPSSRWVLVSRDIGETARSLEKLYAARSICGSGERWLSAVMQSTMERYTAAPLSERCARQIGDMAGFLDKELSGDRAGAARACTAQRVQAGRTWHRKPPAREVRDTRRNWRAGGSRVSCPYVFNSPDYLEIEAERLGGKPVRLAFASGPEVGLILRQVPRSILWDGVSVYGYPDLDQRQPVAGSIDADRILEALRSEAMLERPVSAFFRLGLDQEVLSPYDASSARKVHVGDVVVIDLQREWSQIFSGFRTDLRASLRKADPEVVVAASEDIAAFHAIYTENMARVGAHKSYFFSLAYMRRLLSITGVDLFLATDGTGPLAGALIVSHADLLFYHLGAATIRGLARSALKCVLSEVARQHAGDRFRSFVLGGGLGGESDTLLQFKRGFSNEMRSVHALKAILDNRSYATLSGACGDRDPFAGFFPEYRDPARIDEVPE